MGVPGEGPGHTSVLPPLLPSSLPGPEGVGRGILEITEAPLRFRSGETES